MARKKEQVSSEIRKYIKAYEGSALDDLEINVLDCYLAGGYGLYHDGICETIRKMIGLNGVPLDATYTGKAFWGMCEYIRKTGMRGRDILFIHTGGTPLFFDGLNSL